MEQVTRFLPGGTGPGSGFELRYSQLRGDTGALVYPAAHVYIHAALQRLSHWDAVHWTTEYVPKGIEGYAERTHRPADVIHGLQAGYTLLYLAIIATVWAVYEGAWTVRGGMVQLDYGSDDPTQGPMDPTSCWDSRWC